MKKEDLEKLFNNIEEKLGKENYSKMADDLGLLMTDNENMNNIISNKDNEIEQLNKNNEILITANGNLLQQVGMSDDSKKQNDEKEEKKKVSLKSAFDEKGNFID